ncbi:MAG: WG repeat-containing protein [Candidatus Riflebacteria bacterium]|nr:WG repeat-containing protein [Candidatus Riflebacteria bacterium]
MKKKITCILIFSFFMISWVSLYSQDAADPRMKLRALVQGKKEQNYKYGYIDIRGNFAIPCQYDSCEDFNGDYAKVGGYGKFVFINRDGKPIHEGTFSDANNFNNGLAPVKSDSKGLWGYIGENGELVIPAKFEKAGEFSDGLAYAIDPKTKKMGFIDVKGDWVIEPEFSAESGAFENGVAVLKGNRGPSLLIDKQGKELKKFSYAWVNQLSSGYARYCVQVDGNARVGYLDSKGEIAIPAKFSDCHNFVGDAATALDPETQKWGLIDRKGEWIVAPEIGGVGPGYLSEGLIAWKRNDLYGFLDEKGNEVIKPLFKSAEAFKCGISFVSTGKSTFGFIDKTGKVLDFKIDPKMWNSLSSFK